MGKRDLQNISDKGFLCRIIFKKFLQFNNKKTRDLIYNGQMNRYFLEEVIQMANKHKKTYSLSLEIS